MTFKRKVILSIALAIIVSLPGALISFWSIQGATELISSILMVQERLHILEKFQTVLSDFERGHKYYMLMGEASYLEPYSQAEASFNDIGRKFIALKFPGQVKAQSISSESSADADLAHDSRINQIVKLKDQWIQKSSVPQMMARKKFDRGMLDSNQFVATMKSFDDKKQFDAMSLLIQDLKTEESTELARVEAESSRQARIAKWSSLASTLIFLLSFLVVFQLVIRSSRNVENLVSNLDGVIQNASDSNHKIRSISLQLSAVIEQQAAALQATSATATELASTVEKNSSYVSTSKDMSEKGSTAAMEGNTKAQEMLQTVEQMKSDVGQQLTRLLDAFARIEQFVNRVQAIKEKTKIINEIVFQTKLLSFNAAVEAARAGEHGRGFAVVADEVGRLSKVSGESAVEIETTLQEAIEYTVGVVSEARSSVGNFERIMSTNLKNVLGACNFNVDAYARVRDLNSQLEKMMFELKNSSDEQKRKVDHIEGNFKSLTAANSETSEAAHSTSQVISEMNSAIANTEEVVNQLRSEFISSRAA